MGSMLAQNVILLANLVAVGIYVWITWGIKKASNEQSEGLSKPVLVLRSTVEVNPLADGKALAQHIKGTIIPCAEANTEGHLELINIGNGPALQVICTFRDLRQPSQKPITIECPYLQAKQHLPLPLSAGNTMNNTQYTIHCNYNGLSEGRYRSEIELKAKDVERFKFYRVAR